MTRLEKRRWLRTRHWQIERDGARLSIREGVVGSAGAETRERLANEGWVYTGAGDFDPSRLVCRPRCQGVFLLGQER